MKFKKLFILIVASILLFPGITVWGTDKEKDVTTILSEEYLEASKDITSIEEVLDESAKEIQNILQVEEIPYFNEECFVKMYYLQDSDIVEHYRINKKFEENIKDDYKWIAPVLGQQDILLANFIKDEEKWYMAGFSDGLNTEGYSFLIDKEKILKVLYDNDVKSADEIKLVRTERYFTNIIYINKENEELGIPFSNNSEMLGFQNGKLYTMDELIDRIEENYTVETIDDSYITKKADEKRKKIVSIFIVLGVITTVELVIVNRYFLKSKKIKEK